MVLVNVCPKNVHDVLQASNRLGCGNDSYGNNQYLCLPNKDKSSLVEFCFQGVMGIVEKGTFICKNEIPIVISIFVNKDLTYNVLI